jgi:hypothetical protein
MAPLSGNQHREYLKMQAEEARKGTKMEREEARKQQMHEIKLQEAAGGANQKMGHKEQVHQAKMQEQVAPLASRTQVPRREGQAGPTDTVPAMLTPGEAVIPRSAAQDPKNKEAIEQMVTEGREGYNMGTAAVPGYHMGSHKVSKGYAMGTSEIPGYTEGTTSVSEWDNSAVDPQVGLLPVPEMQSPTGISPAMLEAQRGAESNNQHIDSRTGRLLTSPKGAEGIAQIMPATAKDPGYGVMPARDNSPEEAMRFQSDYMNALNTKYQDPQKALAAYNYGPGSMDKLIAKHGDEWKNNLPTETSNYLKKINASMVPAKAVPESADLMRSRQLANDPSLSPNDRKFFGEEVKRLQGAPSVPVGVTTPTNVLRRMTGSANLGNRMGVQDQQPVPMASPASAPAPQAIPEATPVEVPADTSQIGREGFNAAKDSQAAYISQAESGKIEALKAAAVKTDDPKGFLERGLSVLFGDKGLFNSRELARFALVAAGGMISGGSTGGSLRYASKDVLQAADRRFAEENLDTRAKAAQEATENKAMSTSLVTQGYEPAKIKAFLDGGSKDAALLGAPRTTTSRTGQTKQYTFESGNGANTPIIFEERTTVTGNRPGEKVYVNPETGMSLAQYRAAITARGDSRPIVSYETGTHGDAAVTKRLADFTKDLTPGFQKTLESQLGAETSRDGVPNKSWANAKPAYQYADQARSLAIAHDIRVDNPQIATALKPVINNAINKAVADMRNGKTQVIDFAPYIEAELFQFKTGISPDAFQLGKGDKAKDMIPGKIVTLNAMIRKTFPEGSVSEVEGQKVKKLKSMYNEYKGETNKWKDSESESAFYQFAMNKLRSKKE